MDKEIRTDKTEDIEDKVDRGEAERVKSTTYSCEACGSNLVFDPATRHLKCVSCAQLYPMPDPVPVHNIYYTGLSETEYEDWGEIKCVRCENCGAITTLDKYQTSIVCPFCGSPTVADFEQIPGHKPNAVLPFAVTEAEAHKSFVKWLKRRIFAPHKVKKDIKKHPMNGVYIPTWVFNSSVNCAYEARFGQTYTVRVGSGKNARTVTRTRWFNVSGQFTYNVNDLAVEASNMITQKQLGKIDGFDISSAVAFEDEYLAGFSSERYSVGLDDSWNTAQRIVNDALVNIVRRRHPHDREDYVNVYPVYEGTTYKYVLAPLWVSAYKYRDKQYGFVVNGRNGKVVGNSPVSMVRAGIASLLAFAAAGGLIYLIYYLFFM